MNINKKHVNKETTNISYVYQLLVLFTVMAILVSIFVGLTKFNINKKIDTYYSINEVIKNTV